MSFIFQAGYSTLNAFVEFISAFEVPSSSVLSKDVAAFDVGKPFSPLMFDGILKNFSPDLPCGIKGRPRFVDVYLFISILNSHPWLWFFFFFLLELQ